MSDQERSQRNLESLRVKRRTPGLWVAVGLIFLFVLAPQKGEAAKKSRLKQLESEEREIENDIKKEKRALKRAEKEYDDLKNDAADGLSGDGISDYSSANCSEPCKPKAGGACSVQLGRDLGVGASSTSHTARDPFCLQFYQAGVKNVDSRCWRAAERCGLVQRDIKLKSLANKKKAAQAALELAEDDLEDVRSKIADIRDCVNCRDDGYSTGGLMVGGGYMNGGIGLSDREPTLGESIVAGLHAVSPMVTGAIGAYSYNKGLSAYYNGYNSYLDQCTTIGVPCTAPAGIGGGFGGFGGIGGFGGAVSGGFGMAGGIAGVGGIASAIIGGFGGGIAGGFGGTFGGGYGGYGGTGMAMVGGYGVPMAGGFGGMGMGMGGAIVGVGGFGGMGMTGGWGVPVGNYGSPFYGSLNPFGSFSGGFGGGIAGGIAGAITGGFGMTGGYGPYGPGGVPGPFAGMGYSGGFSGGITGGFSGGFNGGFSGGVTGGYLPGGYFPGGGFAGGVGISGVGGFPQMDQYYQQSMQQQQLAAARAAQSQTDLMVSQQQIMDAQGRYQQTLYQANQYGSYGGGYGGFGGGYGGFGGGYGGFGGFRPF